MSKVLLLLVLLGVPGAGVGQAPVLVEMASHAGVIFSGEVVSVARQDALGYVEVGFRVDAAVRGCSAGGTYTVKEWAGRWTGHPERYRVGQRLLMLLTAPGASGLSAPVYGTDGAVPVVAGPAGLVVDLRLLATRVPVGSGGSQDNFILVGPVGMDGTGSGAVWPALGDVLALLRGGASAWR